ncbi:MAG: class II aldolase/adducin family protein [Rhodobacteraceae bacterium]|nr:class II aldolase/adducin family protein [Paracoccaceae bacterium]
MASPDPEFLALSAVLGSDPLQVQGAGGNTSVKNDRDLWVKASGTRLADAQSDEIFVRIPLADIRSKFAEWENDPTGDLTLEAVKGLRPSIETTFHGMLDHVYVIHTHSIATLIHAISPDGRARLATKLAGLPYARIPYTKPGPGLTQEIMSRRTETTQVFILYNHGLICCGDRIDAVRTLLRSVEERLFMPPRQQTGFHPDQSPEAGYHWSPHSWLAQDGKITSLLLKGSYYPDHVVFLGPTRHTAMHSGHPPILIKDGVGILVRNNATPAQRAMLQCLADVMQRIPLDWDAEPIGAAAEAELLDWDAEKYRQAMARQP